MKHYWQIITILLAVVLVILSTNSLFVSSEQQEALTPDNEQISNEDVIINSIMSRTSVRHYTDEFITDDQVEKILKAGMSAPTAGNRQPWEFFVVRDTSLIKQFTSVTKYTAPMNESSKLAIIVCGDPEKSFPGDNLYWVQDTSAATENILLATHAMGLGAVWCGVYPGLERVATLKKLLNLPEELTPLNIILMGYPAKEQNIKDKWKPEKVHYIN